MYTYKVNMLPNTAMLLLRHGFEVHIRFILLTVDMTRDNDGDIQIIEFISVHPYTSGHGTFIVIVFIAT